MTEEKEGNETKTDDKKWDLAGKVLPVIVTAVAGIIVAFLTYQQGIDSVKIPLNATQTAEARNLLLTTPTMPPTVSVTAVEITETPTPLPIAPATVGVTEAPPPPSVSLLGLSYKVNDFDPRLVDLRKASSSGIPAEADSSLQFFDLWVSITKDAPTCDFWAEIYDDPQLTNVIGVTTESPPFRAGLAKLGEVKIEKFNDGNLPNAWRVQSDWADLHIVLITFCDNEIVYTTVTTIHLDVNGTAWLLDPPNASIASIIYSVNGEPEQMLDLRFIMGTGLGVEPGDEVRLLEIWYHSNSVNNNNSTIRAEAHLSLDGFDPETHIVTKQEEIQTGIHKLADSAALSWTIPNDRETLFLALLRNDGQVMDRLEIPLGSR